MTPTNRPGWTWDAETAEWRHVSGYRVRLDWLTNKWRVNKPYGNVMRYKRKYLLDAMRIAEREAGQ